MERILTGRSGRENRGKVFYKKIMSDKIAEEGPKPEEIEVAYKAHEKYGNIPGGPGHLSSATGAVSLDTIEENIKLESQTSIDPLTGLLNERARENLLEGLEAGYERHQYRGVFIVADLTGLHDTNENISYAAGDDYLKSAGLALQGASRKDDRAFRSGRTADEFLLYLPGIHTKEGVEGVMDRVDEILNEREKELRERYPNLNCELSYSIANFDDETKPREAYEEARERMTEAKKSKSGERVGTVGRLYSPRMEPITQPISIPVSENV